MATPVEFGLGRRGVIVVGIDFSPGSDRAATASSTLVRETPGTDIHLVHVATPWAASRSDLTPRAELAQLDELLQATAQRYFASTRRERPRIFTHLLEGNPALQIVQLATDVRTGLIVIGTNGRSSGTRLALGSVADGVLRIANCTVLVVRPNGLELAPVVQPPCPACLEVQRSVKVAELWCERHEKKHLLTRAYFDEPPAYGAARTGSGHN